MPDSRYSHLHSGGYGRREALTIGKVDWVMIFIYAALVIMGWFNIYAAVYDDAHSSIFDISQRYGMQAIWIGVSVFIGISILLIDDKYYHILSYPFYWIAVIVLLAVLFLGKEVNGAKSWIMLGPVALQPTEMVKFATSLALARYMSNYTFNIHRPRDLMVVGLILGIPAGIVILQNDTGSALVYGSFLMMLFREGFSRWVYVAILLTVSVFVMSFLLEPEWLLILLILVCAVVEGLVHGNWKSKIIYLATLALGTIVVYFASELLNAGDGLGIYWSLLLTTVLSLPAVFVYSHRHRIRDIYVYLAMFFGALSFSRLTEYIFDNVLQVHQQKRILDLLGIESDLRGWGYNVNQSKIAIGSGGLLGKGYLEGTQTKYNFVPEQSTDFIFCTVGEEWGFVGSSVVVVLFMLLILRLIRMGERQNEPFGRIYCYCAASIFFFHTVINIGMTIGIMPVIGIPLPFFSYGGSSLIAFTLLLFVAIRLDMSKRKVSLERV